MDQSHRQHSPHERSEQPRECREHRRRRFGGERNVLSLQTGNDVSKSRCGRSRIVRRGEPRVTALGDVHRAGRQRLDAGLTDQRTSTRTSSS